MSIKKDLEIIKNMFNTSTQEYLNDKCKVNFEFSCLIDGLNKSGIISDKTTQNAYLSVSKNKNIYIVCKSYKVKI